MQRMLRRFDKNNDRNLSTGEIRAGGWPAEPELFDLDEDGSLSPFEMAAGLSMKRRQREENGITGLDQRQAIEFIAQFDKNRDKHVDAEEFQAAESPFDAKKFDTDGDGLLTRDEVALGYAKRRKTYDVKLVDQKNAVGRLNRHDRNRDRELDEEEIMAGKWPEFPERHDLDKNKRLSRFELEVLMARQRNERGVSAEDIAAAARLIKRYDKNGNGYIDSDETEGELPPGVTPQTRVTADTFVDFDDNTDLRLGRNETAEFLASLRAE
jgi:Ca2+-binding EF-hand superfamily protein